MTRARGNKDNAADYQAATYQPQKLVMADERFCVLHAGRRALRKRPLISAGRRNSRRRNNQCGGKSQRSNSTQHSIPPKLAKLDS